MTPTSADAEAWPRDPAARLVRLSHDLRTPLTIVAGFADLLQRRDDLTDAEREGHVARIAAAATQLREILDSERDARRGA